MICGASSRSPCLGGARAVNHAAQDASPERHPATTATKTANRTAPDGDPPQVTATFEPILCGDGVVVDPETCDDGNTVSHDGCSAVCDIEAGSDT